MSESMSPANSRIPAYPEYDSLPLKGGKRSAHGLWDSNGETDHLGAINNITAACRKVAVREVIYGESYQLDWGFHKLGKPAFGRKGLEHKLINYGPILGELAHDDEISFNTQSGSQWDGFMHYADQNLREYYNGVSHSDENMSHHPHFHSIHYWCKSGIVGRGVLLDWPRWLEATRQKFISPVSSHGITVNDLKSIAQHQGVSFFPGDVLIIRTGFVSWYEDARDEERDRVLSSLSFTGVKQGDEIQRWLWNNRFSAVAADSVSWECYPPPRDGSMLHQWLLPHAGIPIGELWDLEALSETCARLKKWSFLFTSAPLNIKGAVASPPNAVALL